MYGGGTGGAGYGLGPSPGPSHYGVPPAPPMGYQLGPPPPPPPAGPSSGSQLLSYGPTLSPHQMQQVQNDSQPKKRRR